MYRAVFKPFVFGVAVLLAACGGGGGNAFLGPGGGGNVATDDLQLYLAGADSSVVGVIDIQKATVPANGSTGIGVRLVDQNGSAYIATSPGVTFFTTECSDKSEFSVSGGAPADQFTPNAAGVIRINWTDNGCNTGASNLNVTLRATVEDNGVQRIANGSLTLEPVTVGSVLNESPLSPVVISLDNQGTSSRPDSQEVEFKVVSENNNPVEGKTVCFSLPVAPDGTTLTADSDVSDSGGLVSVVVSSGSVAGSVVVKASDLNGRASCSVVEPDGTDFSTNTQVVISSGLATQDRFSISADTLNIEGADINGETTSIRIDAADVFSNPIREGEPVVFQASGGRVEGTCDPQNGTCSVVFTSQDPRSESGLVAVMARVKGEEGFIDANGNGRFDDAELGTVTEVGEAFIDANRSNSYDTGEVFIDEEPLNGTRDAGDGKYNGSTCAPDGGSCADKQSLNVWKTVYLVMSRSTGATLADGTSATEVIVTDDDGGAADAIEIQNDQTVTVTIEVAGIHPDGSRQKLPRGTTVVATSDVGDFVGESSFVVGNSSQSGASIFTVQIKDSGDAASGSFVVTVQSPKGDPIRDVTPISQQ